MRRIAVAVFVVLLFSLAAPLWAARQHGYGHRPRWDHSLNVWIDWDAEDSDEGTGKISREDADGVVFVVPSSPSRWDTEVDIGMNTFGMTAPLTLPSTLKSSDVMMLRAIFNDAVDRKTVDTIADGFESLTVSGRLAMGGAFGRVELIQIVVGTSDGRVLIQDLSVGLDVW